MYFIQGYNDAFTSPIMLVSEKTGIMNDTMHTRLVREQIMLSLPCHCRHSYQIIFLTIMLQKMFTTYCFSTFFSFFQTCSKTAYYSMYKASWVVEMLVSQYLGLRYDCGLNVFICPENHKKSRSKSQVMFKVVRPCDPSQRSLG